jgi:putative ABC transport system substrate-binding protein
MEKVIRKGLLAVTLLIVILASARFADAQQSAKIHRIGYLETRSSASRIFQEALRDLGYVEGKNVAFEYRSAEGNEDRLPHLAAELIRLKVGVIVVATSAAARVAQELTDTIPIVLAGVAKPVEDKLVANLARPGGNITGLSFMSVELSGKRLELLKEIFPNVSHVAVIIRTADPDGGPHLRELGLVAHRLAVRLLPLNVQEPPDIEEAFSEIARKRADSLTVIPHPLFAQYRMKIVELAAKSRLPAMYPLRNFTQAGGLMSYGPYGFDLYRRTAYFVDRILKGAKPSDLPVEQPTKFGMVVNLKTAKSLGLTIPDEVLRWADEIIK